MKLFTDGNTMLKIVTKVDQRTIKNEIIIIIKIRTRKTGYKKQIIKIIFLKMAIRISQK